MLLFLFFSSIGLILWDLSCETDSPQGWVASCTVPAVCSTAVCPIKQYHHQMCWQHHSGQTILQEWVRQQIERRSWSQQPGVNSLVLNTTKTKKSWASGNKKLTQPSSASMVNGEGPYLQIPWCPHFYWSLLGKSNISPHQVGPAETRYTSCVKCSVWLLLSSFNHLLQELGSGRAEAPRLSSVQLITVSYLRLSWTTGLHWTTSLHWTDDYHMVMISQQSQSKPCYSLLE